MSHTGGKRVNKLSQRKLKEGVEIKEETVEGALVQGPRTRTGTLLEVFRQ